MMICAACARVICPWRFKLPSSKPLIMPLFAAQSKAAWVLLACVLLLLPFYAAL